MRFMGKIFTFILVAALVFVIAVLIAGSINGLTFTEQILAWFSAPGEVPEVPVE